MPKLNGIEETCLSVADLERSEQFYRDLFDLPVIAGDARFRALDVAGSQVLLLFLSGATEQDVQLPGGTIPAHGASGRSHVAFSISAADLEGWKKLLAERGIVIEGTMTWPRGGMSLYFRDPDEHLLELMTPGVWSTY